MTFAMRNVAMNRARTWSNTLLIALGLLTIMVMAGCGSSTQPWEQPRPEAALRSYLIALAYGDTETAWNFLLEEDQAVLEARATALNNLEGSGPGRSAAKFLSVGHITATASEISAVRFEGDVPEEGRVEVTVELHNGRTFKVPMVRASGRWFVDVPLEAAMTSTGGT